jgi:histidine ammonia-lyase
MPTEPFEFTGDGLNIEKIIKIIQDPKQKISVPTEVLKRNKNSSDFLQTIARSKQKVIYGVNTGFGPMANYLLPEAQLKQLQENLVLSHAVGMGEKIPDDFVLASMLVRLNTLAKGYSGVTPKLLNRLAKFIDLRISPVVPEHGAVGTSGDLVQLAHIALALLGKGQVSYQGKIQKTEKVLKQLRLEPYQLEIKEGLSLINGTSVMTGIAALNVWQSKKLLDLAILSGCLALEVTQAYGDSYATELHTLRPHPGQVEVAKTMRKLLKDSKLISDRKKLNTFSNHGPKVERIDKKVQDVYSFRCIAQILGPVKEVLDDARITTETEMNAVTDNPIVDYKKGTIFHGGNFHGDYISVAMDHLKASITKLTMLSERRVNYLLNPNIPNGFPPFLNLHTPGLTLGLQPLIDRYLSRPEEAEAIAAAGREHALRYHTHSARAQYFMGCLKTAGLKAG